jgi:hypothetical protein
LAEDLKLSVGLDSLKRDEKTELWSGHGAQPTTDITRTCRSDKHLSSRYDVYMYAVVV